MDRGTVYGRFKSQTSALFSAATVSLAFTVILAVFEILDFYFNNHMLSWFYSTICMTFIISSGYLYVMFFLWVYTVTNTAEYFDIDTGTTPKMAVVWFFVPIANLFKPYINMRNMWLGLNNNTSAGYTDYLIIKIWWLIFLGFTFVSQLVLQMELSTTSLASLRYTEYFYIASILLSFLNITILILLVVDFRHKFDFIYNKLRGDGML